MFKPHLVFSDFSDEPIIRQKSDAKINMLEFW